MESKYLKKIMQDHERVADVQVVFSDIEKYSKRKTSAQKDVVDIFTGVLRDAINITSKKYLDYFQKNEIDFQTDLITLPTGDGAAIVFSFPGLNDLHLFFAKTLLELIHNINKKNNCDKFMQNGWCNCHNSINLRIGISEGKAILYKDINGLYNIAGSVINMASRVMNMVDRNQIAFEKKAYDQIIDLIDDRYFDDQFVEYENVPMKHGEKISIYLYKGKSEDKFINQNLPEKLEIVRKSDTVMAKLKLAGLPIPDGSFLQNKEGLAIDILDGISDRLIQGSISTKKDQ